MLHVHVKRSGNCNATRSATGDGVRVAVGRVDGRAIRIVLCAGTHGGRYLLGGRRADDAAARGVLSVCRGGAARRWPLGRSNK